MTSTIWQQIADNAQRFGQQDWLISPETRRTITWAEADRMAGEIADHLAEIGIEKGAPVAIAAHNCLGASLAFIGITYGDYLATPLNLIAGAKVMAYVLDHSRTKIIFCADDNRAILDEALCLIKRPITIIPLHPEEGPIWPKSSPKIGSYDVKNKLDARKNPDSRENPDSKEKPYPKEKPDLRKKPDSGTPALLIYTSGTTGNPKGVVLSQANLLAAGQNVVTAHHISQIDIGLCILPIYHINGLCVTIMGTIMSAGGLVMPYKFSVKSFWQIIKAHHVSWFSAVPTIFAYLINDNTPFEIDTNRLRFARSASAPLAPEIHRQFEDKFLLPIIETMGLTETGAQILSNPMPPETRKIGSPGRAVGNQISICNAELTPVAANIIGEIMVRGPNVMQGYLYQADETAKSITPDGWLKTGDLGYMDEEGFVFVTGRIKELIIKGGENIAPREIDDVLLEYAAILEAAAFGVPCAQYGQRVEACICLKPSYQPPQNHDSGDILNDIITHCISRLGKFKTPDTIHILDDLPKGPSGKIQRLKLYDLVYGA